MGRPGELRVVVWLGLTQVFNNITVIYPRPGVPEARYSLLPGILWQERRQTGSTLVLFLAREPHAQNYISVGHSILHMLRYIPRGSYDPVHVVGGFDFRDFQKIPI